MILPYTVYILRQNVLLMQHHYGRYCLFAFGISLLCNRFPALCAYISEVQCLYELVARDITIVYMLTAMSLLRTQDCDLPWGYFDQFMLWELDMMVEGLTPPSGGCRGDPGVQRNHPF